MRADTLSAMCLLIVASRVDPAIPLVVGANRDERLDRPATAVTVLRDAAPRIVGGRDDEAGGTWLAVNEDGVVAGLTNRPSRDGRDPTKRTRGELPLALAQHRDARSAAADLAARVRPEDYNPAWLLVGDRTSLFGIDMTAGTSPAVTALGPGVHVLENNPLGAPSAKVDHVRALLGERALRPGDDLLGGVRGVLMDHSVPVGFEDGEATALGENGGGGDPEGVLRRPAVTLAACVHTEAYGTRSSSVVAVPADDGPPRVWVADGPPCTAAFEDATGLWRGGRPAR